MFSLFSAIANYGRVLGSSHIPKRDNNPQKYISYYITENHLHKYSQIIEESPAWNDKSNIYDGVPPYNPINSNIHPYLTRHSIRVGFFGKLAGLIYRVTDTVRGIVFGRSDRLNARDEIVALLLQVNKLQNNEKKATAAETLKPVINHTSNDPTVSKANRILAEMLRDYNSQVLYSLSKTLIRIYQ